MPIPIYVQAVASSVTTAQLISYPAQTGIPPRGITTCINYGRHYIAQIRNRRIEAYPVPKMRRGQESTSCRQIVVVSLCRLFLFDYLRHKDRHDLSIIKDRLMSREMVTRAIFIARGITIFSRINRHRRSSSSCLPYLRTRSINPTGKRK